VVAVVTGSTVTPAVGVTHFPPAAGVQPSSEPVHIELSKATNCGIWKRTRSTRTALSLGTASDAPDGPQWASGDLGRAISGSRTLASAHGDGKDLALALTGAPLPAARLESLRGHHLSLRGLSAGWLIVYCFPGAHVGTEESHLDDERDHHAYAREQALFKRRTISVASLSSEPRDLQTQTMLTHELSYHIILDPELCVADELGLPTFSDGELRAYKRLTLIARAGMIQRVFYPIARGGRSAQQALTWMALHAGLDSLHAG
jgi:peroxiredoxin